MEFNKNASSEECIKPNSKRELISSSLSTDSESSSSSESNQLQSYDQEEDDSLLSTNSSFIKDVYNDNFEEAIKEISTIPKEYNFIGMDTEFPGIIYNVDNITKDFYYQTMKINVNSTKLIQVGITFTNKYGEYPTNNKHYAYQFNLSFDEEKDKFSQESINLLKNNGIDFQKLKKKGIKQEDFAKKLLSLGLVLNPNYKWVSYQGSYDFAYLLRLLIKDNLPESEDEFMKLLQCYFPKFYDVRMLVRDDESLFYGGLNKLIANLDIERKGINHQAGSDAIATIEAFHELIDQEKINNNKMKTLKNVLYGLGMGEDNENTIKYINTNNAEIKKENIQKENNHRINNDMMSNNQNYAYNNMIMRNMYLQQIQNQKQMNNMIMCNNMNNMNNCLQYALLNTFNRMRNNILINNMQLIQMNV